MATVKLLLEKSRSLRDGSFSLVFRVIHRRCKRTISSPHKLFTSEYDPTTEKVIYLSEEYRSQESVNTINKSIIQQRLSILSHISELELLGKDYDTEQIISRYYVNNKNFSLLGYIDNMIEEKQKIGKTGTAIAYRSTRSSLNKFLNDRPFAISDVDVIFVKEYENYLLQSGLMPNTVCYYIRNFKSIYAQALCQGIETSNLSPFKSVTSKPQKTIKRALNSNAICRIKSIKLTGDMATYTLSRDLFMFSFYTRGMPFVDMFYLKKKSINHNVIAYCRRKTGQWLQVALTSEAKAIIKRYDSDGEYVFPMFNDNNDDLHKVYGLARDKTNYQLKKIGKMLKLDAPLTTYVARHCWATQAKELGFSTSVISEGLGHSSEKITQIYLKEFDRSVLDDANIQIMKGVFAKARSK